ncbi:Glyoxalase/Bleomycin resistance protein/Dihydroxybiphenyl dioxygenase [Lasiosphaeria hispida]|uniref:Glyoxalase/Bleomycin resistance protein/Dihydroxybiphenyl dioxygenase n=1 Tax=Lasiosphaeria hispida TaxID=260671 RepID=A0AAJ0MET9_9PEZI|nr:Glyoxalase/Bleomycin resistance protein/Dihydroxybiphenyl dioxygenase [Lasiosphaeria hispida]
MADWKPPKTGSPVWIEITATDLARSHKFYSTVFNWTFKNPEVLTASDPDHSKPVMVDFNPDVNISGGISRVQSSSAPKFAPHPGRGGICLYWLVDDVEATGKVIKEAGGKMLSEAQREGDHGLYRYFEDVDGNLGGVYQFKPV